MRGHALRVEMARLALKHRVTPVTRAPLPLLPAVTVPQIVSGLAASPHLDSDRMSFQPGALSWPAPDHVPLLVRHDANRIAGKIISLDYRDGELYVSARVDDLDAARMPAFSVTATVTEAE